MNMELHRLPNPIHLNMMKFRVGYNQLNYITYKFNWLICSWIYTNMDVIFDHLTKSWLEPCRLRVPCPALPCPALPGQVRAGYATSRAGEGRARLRKFLKGRLQVMNVLTCQPAINFVYQIFSTSFLKLNI